MSRIRKASLWGAAFVASMALAFGGTVAANATTLPDPSATVAADATPTPSTGTEEATASDSASQVESTTAPTESPDVTSDKSTDATQPDATSTTESTQQPTGSADEASAPSTPSTDQPAAPAVPAPQQSAPVGEPSAQVTTDPQVQVVDTATGLPRTTASNVQAVTDANGRTTISFNYSLLEGYEQGYVFTYLYKGSGVGGQLVDEDSVITKTHDTKTFSKTLDLEEGVVYTLHVTGDVDCFGDCYGEAPIVADYTFTVKVPSQCDITSVDISKLIVRGDAYNSVVIPATKDVKFINAKTSEELKPGTIVIPEEGLTIKGEATSDCVEVTGSAHFDYTPLTKVEKSQTSKTDCDSKQVVTTHYETTYTRTSAEAAWVEGDTKVVSTETRVATDDELKAAQCVVVTPPVVVDPPAAVVPVVAPKPVAETGKTLAATGFDGNRVMGIGGVGALLVAVGVALGLVRRSQRRRVNSES